MYVPINDMRSQASSGKKKPTILWSTLDFLFFFFIITNLGSGSFVPLPTSSVMCLTNGPWGLMILVDLLTVVWGSQSSTYSAPQVILVNIDGVTKLALLLFVGYQSGSQTPHQISSIISVLISRWMVSWLSQSPICGLSSIMLFSIIF